MSISSTKVSVKSSAANTVSLALVDNDSSNEIWRVGQAADGDGYVEVLEDGGTVGCKLDASGNSFTMGNFGVGVASPGVKLHVDSGSSYSVGTFNSAHANGILINLQRNGTNTGFIGSGKNIADATGGVDDVGMRSQANLIFTSGGGTERARIDTAGRLFLGRTAQHASSSEKLSVNGMVSIQKASTSTAGLYIFNEETTTSGNPTQPFIYLHDGSGIRGGLGVQRSTGITALNGQFGLSLRTGASGVTGTERLHIDSSGLISNGGLLPSSYGSPKLLISGTNSLFTMMGNGSINNSSYTGIKFRVAGGSTGDYTKAGIFVVRQSSYNDLDMLFCFNKDANATGVSDGDEKVRIDSDGGLRVNCAGPVSSELFTVQRSNAQVAYFDKTGTADHTTIYCRNRRATGTTYATQMQFLTSNGTAIGYISTHGSNTLFGNNSDYRLKENVVNLTNAITRIKNLKPYRFNFKATPTETVDGFYAHEASTVVGNAVVGDKDAVNDDGSIKAQAMDNAKLVPLLTAALQEAIAEIETLKTKVAALESA